ncbi:periplasmic divalent cation tolerance protein [Rhodovulum bhavnagarense]|uniref:Periplasmic divalent cation tolerance protein n=1 Tax=Rhodovulum bhavnagarense TaxID=992286 RepID=A0A4R2RFI8_9RHOB|nr:divalent-cation tolerance protein CutA [Rhodovulum bhavnagarense]TCP62370.1 periplasmic divalent cation tolerance protein [Rhodovulum bhavnagarense]
MLHLTTTCPDIDAARRLAHAALNMRLAACVNILPGVISLFHWKSGIEEADEVQITFKTTEACRADLIALIESEHPYDLPVITWEEVETTEDAAAWLGEETG